ncbi:2-keto-4-pentenoate hydratase [Roseiterribacter gracilis]
MHQEWTQDRDGTAQAIAERFVRARQDATSLSAYPGPMPPDLATAYQVQDHAIALVSDKLVGWKVGLIAPGLREQYGIDRLAGPIFARNLRKAPDGDVIDVPLFKGGFAAVEAEFVYRLGEDAPEGKEEWSDDEALALVDSLHVGIELAGSPFAEINDHGPAVTASDFGNNAGMLLGPSIASWRARGDNTLRAETYVDEKLVGSGTGANIPGGPVAALRFLLTHCAKRNRPLKAGDLVTTGAATGIHEIRAGQTARVEFGSDGTIKCRAVDARKTAGVAAA